MSISECAVGLPQHCIVCGMHEWRPHFKVLQQCRNCTFIRANPEVDLTALPRLYQESYFHGDEYGDYLSDKEVHRKNFRRRLREIRQSWPSKSVFEIGCAYGVFLELLGEHGIESSGIDIGVEPVQFAVEELGQTAVLGDFLTHPIEPGQFDLYCMWDTIEHLPRPELFVQRICDLLPRGGILAFTTGDIGSRLAKWQGRHWRMIHPPTHLHYFSRKTAAEFARRCGFGYIQTRSVAIYRNLHSVLGAYVALNQGLSASCASVCQRILPNWLQQFVGVWVNLGDIMLVTAVKP